VRVTAGFIDYFMSFLLVLYHSRIQANY